MPVLSLLYGYNPVNMFTVMLQNYTMHLGDYLCNAMAYCKWKFSITLGGDSLSL